MCEGLFAEAFTRGAKVSSEVSYAVRQRSSPVFSRKWMLLSRGSVARCSPS